MASERFLYFGDDDPFAGSAVATPPETTAFPAALPDDAADYAGRWVLLRDRKVVAASDDLEELLRLPERQPDDVSAFVRDPDEAYH